MSYNPRNVNSDFTVSTYFGGTLGGSDDTTCIQATIDACWQDGSGGIVVLPPRLYPDAWKAEQLIMRQGVHFKGVGWHSYITTNGVGGTRLAQLSGVNDDFIITDGSSSHATTMGITDIVISGASGATAGNGINLRLPVGTHVSAQDMTTFARIHAYGFAESGFKAGGGVPLVIRDFNGVGNGRYAVEIDDFGAICLLQLDNISGDANMGGVADGGGAVVYLKNIGSMADTPNPWGPVVIINGLKSEYRTRTTAENGDGTSFGGLHALIIDDCDCPILVSGINHMAQFDGDRKAGNAIQIIGSVVPNLQWSSVNPQHLVGQTVGSDPYAVYDAVNSRGTNAHHGVWGPTGFAMDKIGAGATPVVQFVEQSSAVNNLAISNRATGLPPYIQSFGSDTNVSLGFSAKGTGTFQFYTGAGTTTT